MGQIALEGDMALSVNTNNSVPYLEISFFSEFYPKILPLSIIYVCDKSDAYLWLQTPSGYEVLQMTTWFRCLKI